MKSSTAACLLTLLVVGLAVTAITTIGPPPVVPETAPADQFSAARAMAHVRTIAKKPHAMGTEAHAEVRQYLVDTLASLGLEPQLQETTVLIRGGRGDAAARVVNVLGRLLGREQGKAVLLVSHYDSVPQSYGASDDGSGVAAMLEALRALRAAPQLRNDVIFLFTDGEEAGLFGAQAFTDQHPWINDVGVMINLEARGTRGPSLMFETSDGNSRLIDELRRGVAHPRATSYSYEIYKLLPNDTDFSIFRRRGLPGMNFAFIHGGTAYHTAQDSIENLDPRSLQHQGEMALGLARRLGETDLGGSWQTGNAVYFNPLGSWLVTYPQSWVWPLAALAALGVLALLIFGWRRRRFQAGRLLLALLAQLLAGALFGGLCFLVSGAIFSSYNFSLWGGGTSYSLSLLGLALIIVALTLGLWPWLIRQLGSENLTAAGLIVWLILTLVVARFAPGADYLFVWPLLGGVLAAFVSWSRRDSEEPLPWPVLATLGLLAVLATLLWASTLSLIGVALGGQAAPALGLLMVLLLAGVLAPLLTLIAGWRRRWLVPALLLGVGLGLVIAVQVGSRASARNRLMTNLFYVLDRGSGTAQWLSFDQFPSRWVRDVVGDSAQRGAAPDFLGRSAKAWQQSAPVGSYEGARLLVLSERIEGNQWQVEFLLSWSYLAHRAMFQLGPRQRIRSLEIDGQNIELDAEAEDPLTLSVHAPPADGVRFTLAFDGTAPFEIVAISQRYELPSLEGASYPPRPPETMPSWGWSSDSTYVRDVLVLQPGMGSTG